MTAKLVCTLETAMYRAMREKQYSAVASNAKVLILLSIHFNLRCTVGVLIFRNCKTQLFFKF